MKKNFFLKYAILLVFLIIMSCLIYERPVNNWDKVPYVGLILEKDNLSKKEIHKKVYNELKYSLNEKDFYDLINVGGKKAKYENFDLFFQNLDSYRSKPLYTYIGWLIYKLGVDPYKSLRFISAFSYLLIGLLICFTLLPIIHKVASVEFLIIILTLYIEPIITLGRLTTPDALSALLLFVVFISYRKECFALFILFCLLSVFCRVDNILTTLIFCILYLKEYKIDFKKFIFSIFFNFIPFIVINFFLFDKGVKSTLSYFNHTFSESIPHILLQYIKAFHYEELSIYVLIFFSLFLFEINKKDKRVLFGILVIISAKLILVPSLQERFYVPYLIIIIIIFLETILAKGNYIKREKSLID